MRTNLISHVAAYVAIVSMLALPSFSASIYAMPMQGTVIARSDADTHAKSDTENPTNSSALAKNTVSKPETATPAPTAGKDQKTQDKKTIGRCWKRLMKMVREVNHAHQKRQQ
ncbi:hypothetical protein WBJ53_29790 [Spirosoma sp. SC4-14]|uniref:hypothetical protein n=1 Tax=Spirosoma sp. SC4-14 TaxID=3128900 RepID=UPI0030D3B379